MLKGKGEMFKGFMVKDGEVSPHIAELYHRKSRGGLLFDGLHKFRSNI